MVIDSKLIFIIPEPYFMKRILLFSVIQLSYFLTFAQDIDKIINAAEVERIERILASDDMQGRKTFTPGIDKAAEFIAAEFKKSGLEYFKGLTGYLQPFTMNKTKFVFASGMLDNIPLEINNIIAVTTDTLLSINELSGYTKVTWDSSVKLMNEASKLLRGKNNYLVLINTHHTKNFGNLKRFNRESFPRKTNVIFILTDKDPVKYNLEIMHQLTNMSLSNVIGVLPGKSKKDEFIIFSSHYDHLGIGKPNDAMDSVYNGANDNAAGTTGVILLANYFSKVKNNERTLIFIAFTAEEAGGFGSQYFSRQLDTDKTVAMFNIEMIGTTSMWGKNSAYITGFEKSDFGKILQSNLAGNDFHFEPDPYPKQNLFYRSDNATLAALGVPAHTISTSKMDSEKYYHTQEDEVGTLDLANMTAIIKGIAMSSKSIVSGKDTPSRVEKMK